MNNELRRKRILHWFEEGKSIDATHMLIICDIINPNNDYPYFVLNDEAVKTAVEYLNLKQKKIMEIYSYRLPIEQQLNDEDVVMNI